MDSTFECRRCGFKTSYKPSLRNHLSKKTACVPVCPDQDIDRAALIKDLYHKDYREGCSECQHCGRKFNVKSSLYRHLKTCKNVNSDPSEERYELSEDRYNQLKAEILAELRQCASQTIHNNNCNNVINNTVVINAFGKERTEHLTENRAFMDRVLKCREKGVLDFIKALYFDRENHPENMTVKVTNYKLPYVDTFNGERWIKCDKSEVLENMLDSSCSHIDEHYEEIKQNLLGKFNETMIELIHSFMAQVKDREQHSKFFDELKRRIHLVIVNESNS